LVIRLHEVLPEGAMGTVGLSFGSPTSGAGFDVSTTVASIVGNLKNVENPWNTQLTALESQDTAISSLGTLFSTLSNDMSALTDAEGILSEKTGSSSDTNVLSLTAADSTAIAGTHTVEVANLAQTSSGYLAPIANADDTLTGSITLQVGTSGKSQTITLGSTDNTLSELASAINSSGAGIDASVLTDASGSRLSLVSGTSGANGNINISSNTIADTSNTTSTTLSYSAAAGSTNGTLAQVANAGDTLSGTMSIQVGSGAAQTVVFGAAPIPPLANTIYTGSASGDNTLAGVASAISGAGIGVTANVVNNSLSLSLSSGTTGPLAVTSGIVDTYSALGYASTVAGSNANLTVDGINLSSVSNTVANLIPGVTFQLLAPSTTGAQVQVVIGNDNTNVESTVNQFVTDYNSLVSAMNTQEGNNSSGVPEPLFGSPTLSLLQQQLMNGVNTESPNGYLDSIKNSSDALSGSMSINLAGGLPLNYVAAGSSGTESTAGTLTSVSANDTFSGSISIQVGTGTAENIVMGAAPSSPAANTIYTGSGVNSLAGLASAISGAGLGVTASVTNNTLSLSLSSGTTGALTVTSSIADTSTQTVDVPTASGSNTLAGLASAINSAGIGVTANVVTSRSGSQLVLVSDTEGSNGAVTVASSVTDTTTSTALSYNNGGSDINSLTTLGISVNNDGSLVLDATSLDSVLNSDYSGVVGFFQNANSWGQTFSSMLTNSGTTAGTGILALASSSNSNIESTLNADISKENMYISAQQTSLTAELNSANEIMQQLPSQLAGVNELYSAITGYNQNSGG
jgi:flagellar hook-associated protein 2